jgi:threonine dehydratase
LITSADIDAAAARLAGRLVATPCLHSRTLSAITGAQVWLKFENHQFTASFKERGALNTLLQLDAAERRAGVIAASAGNHAQGLAHHAQREGIPTLIVMPRHTPNVKVEQTRAFGAEVVLAGDGFDDAYAEACRLAADRGMTFVHPYDDARVIAGQGTIALEMLDAAPALDTLVIPIGGGGMIAGMAIAAKARRPDLRVVGVQTERFASMYAAIRGETRPTGGLSIAEGIAVRTPGKLTEAIVRSHVDDIVLVDEDAIERAVLLLLEVEKTVVEGAGATGLAALLAHPAAFAGRHVGLVLCGGNIDPGRLAEVVQRGLVRTGRLTRLTVRLRDLPGSLSEVTAAIGAAGANIEEVHHQRTFTTLPLQDAEVAFVVETRGFDHAAQVVEALRGAGFDAALVRRA